MSFISTPVYGAGSSTASLLVLKTEPGVVQSLSVGVRLRLASLIATRNVKKPPDLLVTERMWAARHGWLNFVPCAWGRGLSPAWWGPFPWGLLKNTCFCRLKIRRYVCGRGGCPLGSTPRQRQFTARGGLVLWFFELLNMSKVQRSQNRNISECDAVTYVCWWLVRLEDECPGFWTLEETCEDKRWILMSGRRAVRMGFVFFVKHLPNIYFRCL